MYICIYRCIYVYVYICIYVYIDICIYRYINILINRVQSQLLTTLFLARAGGTTVRICEQIVNWLKELIDKSLTGLTKV